LSSSLNSAHPYILFKTEKLTAGRKTMANSRIVAMSLAALVIGVALGYGLSIAVPYQLPTSIQKPTISLSANSVKAGEQYTAKLTGFPANTEIYGWTVNENPPRMFSAGTTDEKGELELTPNAPETPGTWPLIACDKDQTNWATATLNVS
jgi:hypothetical protein